MARWPPRYDADTNIVGGFAMSAQSILVLTGIVSAFLAFGISLAWADFYTQQGRKPVVDEHQDAKPPSNSIEERRAA
jgi:hypothetical protein